MTITAAADGSALGNPGPAGWAWYIDDDTWRAGGWPHGTNNMGELKAVLDLLEATASAPGEHLLILCDSQYVINSVTKWMAGWKRKGWRKKDGKPVLNVELLKAIDRALVGRSVEFEWVKGHAGHPLNEAADRRANGAATAYSKQQEPRVGPGFGGASPSGRSDSGGASTRGAHDGAPSSSPSDAAAPSATGGGPAPHSAGGSDDPDDLFSHFGTAEPAAAPIAGGRGPSRDVEGTAFEQVITRELALLSDTVRGSRRAAAALLHPAFREVGASGRVWDREGILDGLAPLTHDPDAADLVAEEIAPGTILLSYSTRADDGSRVLRTSLWQLRDEQWVLRHHQGTPAAAPGSSGAAPGAGRDRRAV